jgi:hypothetical protein
MLPCVEGSQTSAEKRGRVFLRHFQRCMSILSQTDRFFFSVGFAHGLWFEGIGAYVAVRGAFSSFQARVGAILPLRRATISA